ncbi:MAG: DUF58 domain-containing protein, partial [Verrucomicrobiota bacterium]
STGLHRSPQRGASIRFKQHRPYVPGDEVKRIDWKVFARSDRYYIREYEQETSMKATLLLDLSGSMNYKGVKSSVSKGDYAKALALSLASLLVQQQDAVALVTFDTDLRLFIPASSSPSHLQVLEKKLENEVSRGETSLHRVISAIMPRLGRRGLLILISDCLEEPATLIKTLAQMRLQHHEIMVFQIFDEDELEFPFEGWTRFESLEGQGLAVESDPIAIRKTYLENLTKFREELAKGCGKHQIQLYPVTTNESCESALKRHLSNRATRR